MDVAEDAADVVGAEAGGQSGEMRVGGFCWNGIFEVAAVGEEDSDDGEEEGDAGGRCRFPGGNGGLGWFGGLRLLVHGGGTNIER